MLRDGRAVIKLRPSKLLMHTMQSLKICSRTLYTNLQGPQVPTKSAVLFAAVGTRTCMLRDGRGCYKITANKTGLCTRYFLFQYTPRVYIPIYRALERQKKAQFSLRWLLLAHACSETVEAVIREVLIKPAYAHDIFCSNTPQESIYQFTGPSGAKKKRSSLDGGRRSHTHALGP